MIDDCSDSIKKFVELLMVSEEDVFVDDFVELQIEELNLDEESDINVLGQYYNIFASMSSVSSRLRIATEKLLTEQLLEQEIMRLEEE
tara:strand:+ start:209 stop:472 length:264 start_codon:yes stop_codon:yes gene_type:complete